MFFRKKRRTKPNVPDGCHAYLRLTDKGLTYFSRMTFQNELERLGIRHAEGEWETIAEMVRALDGTGLSIAVAVLPFEDVLDISQGRKRLVCSGSPSSEDRADDGAGKRADDSQESRYDDGRPTHKPVCPERFEVAPAVAREVSVPVERGAAGTVPL